MNLIIASTFLGISSLALAKEQNEDELAAARAIDRSVSTLDTHAEFSLPNFKEDKNISE